MRKETGLRKRGERKSERRKKVRGREASRQTERDGTDMGELWQVLHHLLRHCRAARKQSLGFSREQPSP